MKLLTRKDKVNNLFKDTCIINHLSRFDDFRKKFVDLLTTTDPDDVDRIIGGNYTMYPCGLCNKSTSRVIETEYRRALTEPINLYICVDCVSKMYEMAKP